MDQRRLRSGAGPDAPRARLLSGWALGGIALMVGATLVLVFPRRALIEEVQREGGNESLTLAYLTNLVKTEPGNAELGVLLAEKKFALGEPDEARVALASLRPGADDSVRRRALRLEYRILETEALAKTPGSEERAAAQQRLLHSLRSLAGRSWPVYDLVYFARQASSLGDARLARDLYARLIASGETAAPQWLEEASAIELGAGNYGAAADLLFALQARASSRADKREYFRRAVSTLQSGNRPQEALRAAEQHIGELDGDEQTLQFLARVALAANDPARALRYVRRLMRMSWLDTLARGFAALDWIAPAHAAEETPAGPPPKGMRPYDETLYALAYDVFLANAKLEDAYKVAAAAVSQAPADLAWRERLAQVAEWSGKPAEALQQWLHLSRKTGSDAALQGILRLAPGLADDDALLYAWQQSAKKRAPDAAQWREIAALYERLGRPEEGVQFLDSAGGGTADPALLELTASLLERAGRTEEAIGRYRRLIDLAGNTPERAAKLATLYLLKADFAQAYAVLAPLRGRVASEKTEYWALLAELAWRLQQDDAALQAYGVMAALPNAESVDAERLVLLMRSRAPQEAARVAESLYRRLNSAALVIAAAEIYWERRDLPALQRLYSRLAPEDEARLAGNAYFYTLRASYHQARNEPRAALADSRRALAIDPASTDLRTGLLWLLLDLERRDELRRQLQAWRPEAAGNSAYWSAYAAAYMSLGEPRQALSWYARQIEAKGDDYLWLLGYADALEAAGDAPMAWRVRRHAWTETRRRNAGRLPQERAALLAYARQLIQFAPGDPALAVLRRLLRQDTPQAPPQDAATQELVLSWMLSGEQHEAARIWLWQQYGRGLAKPLWAEVSVALVQNDVDALDRLLETRADAIPAYDRIEAARAIGDLRRAQSYAFESQEQAPHDDELHLRLATDMLATANSVILRDVVFARGALAGRERAASVNLWSSPRLRLSLELGTVRQTSQDGSALTGVPGVERQAGVSALLRHGKGETEIGIARRSALTEFNSLRLAHTARWAEGVSANLGLTRHERAGETIPLAIGGHRDRIAASLNYAFSKREYLRVEGWSADYHTQHGQSLGAGRGLNYELGHKLRTEYPDANLRYSGSIQHYSAAEFADAGSARFTQDGSIPPGSLFLPQSFKLQGLNLGLGTAVRDGYTRALRPYADFGRSHNSLSGNGYNWLAGAAGSVLGPDNLALYLTRSRGGGGTNISVKEFGLRYQLFFDRY
jgi:Flp pilus assembly protein TadD